MLKTIFFALILASTVIFSACAPQGMTIETDPPTTGPVIVWERSGGIAGVCQRLTVNGDGTYLLQDCSNDQIVSEGTLPKEHWTVISAWLQEFGDFTYNVTPPSGSADMFTDLLTFDGSGATAPSQELQAQIATLISQITDSLFATGGISNDDATGNEFSGNSGIVGQVLMGPICPGPVSAGPENTECADKPYQTSITVMKGPNAPVAQLTTDAEGKFTVELPPGTYTLVPQQGNPLPMATEQTVIVEEGRFTEVTILYDTGIR